MGHRLHALDSTRGLAALTVVFSHSLLVFPGLLADTRHGDSFRAVNLAKYTPLHALWGGHEAVVFFFVLSGFVLALPFADGARPGYGGYVVRRICRIYLPYVVACACAFAAATFAPRGPIAGLSDWFNGVWAKPVSAGAITDHLLLVHTFDSGAYDPVLWSLVHEMRISLLFPVIARVATTTRWPIALGAGVTCSFAGYVATAGHRVLDMTSWVFTLFYVGAFTVGAVMAAHRHALMAHARSLGAGRRAALSGAALLLYTFPWLVARVRPGIWQTFFVTEWATTLGASCFVLLALGSDGEGWLVARPLRWLGKVSYSLYLLHAIVILTVVHLLYGRMPTVALVGIGIAASLGLAEVAHTWVEAPATALGRRLVGGVRGGGQVDARGGRAS